MSERNPAIRSLIDEIVDRYAKNQATADDLASLTNWDVMQYETLSQACTFSRALERRGNTPVAVVAAFLKVFRVRTEQSGALRRLRFAEQVASQPDAVAAAAAAEADGLVAAEAEDKGEDAGEAAA